MLPFDNRLKIVSSISLALCSLSFIQFTYLDSFGPYKLFTNYTPVVSLLAVILYVGIATILWKKPSLFKIFNYLTCLLLISLLIIGIIRHFPLLKRNFFQPLFFVPSLITLLGIIIAFFYLTSKQMK